MRAGRQLIAAVQRKNRRIWLLGWIIGAYGLGAFYLLRSIVSTAKAQQAPYCDSYAHLWLTFSWLLLPLPLICIGGIGYMYYELFRGVVPRGGDR